MRASAKLLFLLAMLVSCRAAPPKQFVDVAGHVIVPAHEWLKLSPPTPLLMTSDFHQLCFSLDRNYRQAQEPMGILDPAGTRMEVRATVATNDGRSTSLPELLY